MALRSGFGSLKTLEEQRITDKITRKFIAGEKGMITWWSVKAGAHAAAHSIPTNRFSGC